MTLKNNDYYFYEEKFIGIFVLCFERENNNLLFMRFNPITKLLNERIATKGLSFINITCFEVNQDEFGI